MKTQVFATFGEDGNKLAVNEVNELPPNTPKLEIAIDEKSLELTISQASNLRSAIDSFVQKHMMPVRNPNQNI